MVGIIIVVVVVENDDKEDDKSFCTFLYTLFSLLFSLSF